MIPKLNTRLNKTRITVEPRYNKLGGGEGFWALRYVTTAVLGRRNVISKACSLEPRLAFDAKFG